MPVCRPVSPTVTFTGERPVEVFGVAVFCEQPATQPSLAEQVVPYLKNVDVTFEPLGFTVPESVALLVVTLDGAPASVVGARSIVYTRQGNPAWSGQDRDGISPIRSDDLFYGFAFHVQCDEQGCDLRVRSFAVQDLVHDGAGFFARH